MSASDPTEAFRALVHREDVPLGEVAIAIAQRSDPTVEAAAVRARLDGLAEGVPAPDALVLLDHLTETCRFRGDRNTYDDPQNSLLHSVLDRRLGLPISLSIVLMEVGRRIGVRIDGIGAPGHFLTRDAASGVFLDVFSNLTLTLDEARATVGRLVPPDQVDGFLEPVPPVRIVERSLANLLNSYHRRSDRHGLRWVTELRALLPDAPPEHHHAHALALAAVGEFPAAADRLDRLADRVGGDRGESLRRDAVGLRARLN